jgi:soluble epoxide hydrolase / lipid-phosphate phosphatase
MYIDTTRMSLIPDEVFNSSKPFLPHLTSRIVDTGHWAMLEDPSNVNKHIREWIEQVVFGGKDKM